MNGSICVPSNELLEKSSTAAHKKCVCRYFILLPREKFSLQTAAGTEITYYSSCSVIMKFHSSYVLILGCAGFSECSISNIGYLYMASDSPMLMSTREMPVSILTADDQPLVLR
jgi:hypothetical protein